MPHASEAAAKAAHMITKGKYAYSFWGVAIGLGHVLPLLYAPSPDWAAGVAALIGLYAFERAYVNAPQEIPNS